MKNILNIDKSALWNDIHEKRYFTAEHQINKAELLVSKIEDKSIEAQLKNYKQQNSKPKLQAREKSGGASKRNH